MRLLLTNDDGIDAPGLAMLAAAAADLGEVFVVAPDSERSGVSFGITLNRPLRLRSRRPGWWSCDGTPTDCVYLAVNHLGLAPDVVLSGLNPGPNLGHDVLHSGTVGGAVEGARWGIGSLALSYGSFERAGMGAAAARLPELLRRLVPEARRRKIALNVNLPPSEALPWGPVRVTFAGQRRYSNEILERRDPRGGSYLWIGGETVTMADIPGSDCNALRDGHVSVTPLGDDLTCRASLVSLADAIGAGRPEVDDRNRPSPPARHT